MTPNERLDSWITMMDGQMIDGVPLVVQMFAKDHELFKKLRDLVRSVRGEMKANELGLEVKKVIYALEGRE